MRTRVSVLLVATFTPWLAGVFLACAPPPVDPRGTPPPALLPSVFPPPDQLVDDRRFASAEPPDAGTPDATGDTAKAPDAGATATDAGPDTAPTGPPTLTVGTSGGSLMYPATLDRSSTLKLFLNDSGVTAEAVKAAVELEGAPSQDELVQGKGTAIAYALSHAEDKSTWDIKPRTPFQIGHWYRLSVAPGLKGPNTQPTVEAHVAFARGPDPLEVSWIQCGYPSCTVEDRWIVSFNSEIDPATKDACIRTEPPLDLGPITVEGWSLTFTPSEAKAGTDYKIIATTACKNLAGDALDKEHEETAHVELPSARIAMVTGTGYIPAAVNGPAPSIDVDAGWTGKLDVGTLRVKPEALPQFLAANMESWSGFSFAAVEPDRKTVMAGPKTGSRNVSVPLGPALAGPYGIVYVRVETEKVSESDSTEVREALVQVTELGISVKSSPSETLVWITSLVDQRPLADVSVSGVEQDGKVLWTVKTDERGMALAPGPKSGGADEHAAVRSIIATRGEDAAFLDLQEYSTRSEAYEFSLPYSWDARANPLRGIVFTERGVYRNGETVHVKGYLRVEKRGKLERLTTPTVHVVINNPRGEEALASDVALGPTGDFEIDLPLGADEPLGSWSIETSVGDEADGNINGGFRVEAYRPNTFEVKVTELQRKAMPAPEPAPPAPGEKPAPRPKPGATVEGLTAKAVGRYYYGASMADAKVRWWIQREDASFSPKGFESYSFEVPTWTDYDWEPSETSVEPLANGDGTLDADGSLTIEAALPSLGDALSKGPANLKLEVEVTDVDEQVVTGRGSLRIESADYYLGVRASTTFMGIGEDVNVDVVALSADGQPQADKAYRLRWLSRDWVSRRISTAGGGTTWDTVVEEKTLEERIGKTGAGPSRATFKAPDSGLYWIEASSTDSQGRTVTTREAVWVWGDGASWSVNSQGHVQLVAAQEGWKVGDTARFVLQSPFPHAQALITVEAGGVLWRDARELHGTAPLIEIPVTDAMMPNAYVSVLIIGNAPGSTRKDAETRLGYTRIKVDTADRRVGVTVTPDQRTHEPGEPMKVTIALADGKGEPIAGQVTFMAVDEGVLSLTGYRTPDPHKAFFVERALAVTTNESRKQMWSLLVPYTDTKSDWGGGGEGGEATNYRSAFATTAAFMPDVAVGPSGQAEVTFNLPDNLTTFRLMAVAATEDGRFGKGESSVEVRKPLLVRPGLPRFLSVGDSFDARAVVQALDPELAGDVDVTLSVSGPVTIDGGDVKRISAGAKAQPVTFAAKANAPGTATFAFKVAAPGKKAADAVQLEIPVTWPAATRTAIASGVVPAREPKASTRIEVPDWIRDDVGGIDVTLTSTRIGELLPGLDYLLKYPYGCVEQTTGGTLPLLALNELLKGFELPGIKRDQVLVRAQAGIDRLRTMQTWSGGLAYWPGDQTPHPWGSVYAGMALVRASKVPGLDVPASTIERLTSYLRDILRDQAASSRAEWHSEIEVVKPYAAYVLALAGTPEPAAHATLFAKRAELPEFGKLLLALAIHESHGDATMASVLLDEVTKTLRVDGASATLERHERRYYWSTMDSDVRSLALVAMALEALRPNDPLLAKVQKGLLDARRGGHWISTQENAFAILALAKTMVATENANAKYTAKISLGGQVWLSEAMRGDEGAPRQLHLPMNIVRAAHGQELVIAREGDEAPLYFSMQFSYAPAEVPTKPIEAGFKLSRRYTIVGGPRDGKPATEMEAGDIVRVDLTVDAPADRRYVAVDDPLPAGLEPITLDFETTSARLSALGGGEKANDDGYYYSPRTFNHTEQRDDRVVLFADVMASGSHTYTYLARATSEGAFTVPAARVHEMYHPDVYGQSAAAKVVVQ